MYSPEYVYYKYTHIVIVRQITNEDKKLNDGVSLVQNQRIYHYYVPHCAHIVLILSLLYNA
jgi:hypothetical protein